MIIAYSDPEQIRRLVMCYYLPMENFAKERGVIVI